MFFNVLVVISLNISNIKYRIIAIIKIKLFILGPNLDTDENP